MFWLSRINEHSTYVGGLLGPMLVTAAGLGMLFMPVTLVALSKVADRDAGVASSLVNTGQQVGGSIGLAILGTVAWTVVANIARNASRRREGRGSQGGGGRPRGAADEGASWRTSRRSSPTTRWRLASPAASRSRPGSRWWPSSSPCSWCG